MLEAMTIGHAFGELKDQGRECGQSVGEPAVWRRQ
jgi:hypothetical protein